MILLEAALIRAGIKAVVMPETILIERELEASLAQLSDPCADVAVEIASVVEVEIAQIGLERRERRSRNSLNSSAWTRVRSAVAARTVSAGQSTGRPHDFFASFQSRRGDMRNGLALGTPLAATGLVDARTRARAPVCRPAAGTGFGTKGWWISKSSEDELAAAAAASRPLLRSRRFCVHLGRPVRLRRGRARRRRRAAIAVQLGRTCAMSALNRSKAQQRTPAPNSIRLLDRPALLFIVTRPVERWAHQLPLERAAPIAVRAHSRVRRRRDGRVDVLFVLALASGVSQGGLGQGGLDGLVDIRLDRRAPTPPSTPLSS